MGLLPRTEISPDSQTYQVEHVAGGGDTYWGSIQTDEIGDLVVDISGGNPATVTVTWYYTDDPAEPGTVEGVVATAGRTAYPGRPGYRRVKAVLAGNAGTTTITLVCKNKASAADFVVEGAPLALEAGSPAGEQVSGFPDIIGPLADVATKRNYWKTVGHAVNDEVKLAWRAQVVAGLPEWEEDFLRLDHLVNDAANVQITLEIFDTADVSRFSLALSVSAAAWQTQLVSKSDGTISAGTWALGEKFTIEVTITMDTDDEGYITPPQLYP